MPPRGGVLRSAHHPPHLFHLICRSPAARSISRTASSQSSSTTAVPAAKLLRYGPRRAARAAAAAWRRPRAPRRRCPRTARRCAAPAIAAAAPLEPTRGSRLDGIRDLRRDVERGGDPSPGDALQRRTGTVAAASTPSAKAAPASTSSCRRRRLGAARARRTRVCRSFGELRSSASNARFPPARCASRRGAPSAAPPSSPARPCSSVRRRPRTPSVAPRPRTPSSLHPLALRGRAHHHHRGVPLPAPQQCDDPRARLRSFSCRLIKESGGRQRRVVVEVLGVRVKQPGTVCQGRMAAQRCPAACPRACRSLS